MPETERGSFSREFKLKVIERLEAGESGSVLATPRRYARSAADPGLGDSLKRRLRWAYDNPRSPQNAPFRPG